MGVSQVCVWMRVCVEISAFFSREYSRLLDGVLVLVGRKLRSGCELGVCVDGDDEGLCRNLYIFVWFACVSCGVECEFDEYLRF